MTPMATKLMTAEEFAVLPDTNDGNQRELVRGRVITMPPAGFYHGLVCNLIGEKLGAFVRASGLGFVTNNDSGVILDRDPDTVRGPDVAYFSRERMPEPLRHGYPDVAPDLVVEVMSPSDVFTRVQDKVGQYLDAKVRLVWVLVPEDRSAAVFRESRKTAVLYNGSALSGEDVLPGFSCPVADLFP